jgi:hypothetical protein
MDCEIWFSFGANCYEFFGFFGQRLGLNLKRISLEEKNCSEHSIFMRIQNELVFIISDVVFWL